MNEPTKISMQLPLIAVPRLAWTAALQTIDELEAALRALAPKDNVDATVALASLAMLRHRLSKIH